MKYNSIEEQIIHNGYICQESGIFQTSLFTDENDPDIIWIKKQRIKEKKLKEDLELRHEIFALVNSDPVAKAIYDKWWDNPPKRTETLCRKIMAAKDAGLLD